MKLSLPRWTVLALACACLPTGAETGPETWRLPLSGQGPSDAVEWDFQVSAGRRAGEKAKIPVPSQWEQHGFGGYDYGTVPLKERHKEDGLYQRSFTVPDAWRGRRIRIVFDGSMTDTTVTVNGQQAGPVHQGAFYRFHHDITDKIRFGEQNHLEVLVSKDSANPTVEDAERQADFWIFGGIFRPVWLEARPPQSIDWTTIDARADGTLRVRVHLDGQADADRLVVRVLEKDGKAVTSPIVTRLSGSGPVELGGRIPGVLPWSAEDPKLYQVEFSLSRGEKVLHRVIERTGFRTVETRPGQGVFVNGRRVTIKGVNRHCFRPKTGRALDPQDSVDDVRLIKSMNMNAVRCSHYSPDKAFLDACDELGLYVIDELCTWQKQVLDTATARRLVEELIRRDANHPSILWWANGNEGGWNTEVDGDYARWDLQQRPVLHPWEEFSGFQTKHYPNWARLQQDLASPHLVMPTEFLHGLYDGGHGAGLEDYWNAITSRPNGVGGFLWVLADEGVARTDRNGEIDNWGTNAPDGIVGPNHEKESSYWTIKDIFSPVQIAIKALPEAFDGTIEVANRYDFRDLTTCRFRWRLRGLADAGGEVAGPAVEPGKKGRLKLPLPAKWSDAEALELTALDREGQELWTWAWPTRRAREQASRTLAAAKGKEGVFGAASGGGTFKINAGGAQFVFDARDGTLFKAMVGDKVLPLARGPRLVGLGGTNAAPLKPVKIIKARANGAESPNLAECAIDGDRTTRWSQPGRDAWLVLEFDAEREVDSVAVDWQHANERKAKWAFDLSDDGTTWQEMVLAELPDRDSGWEHRAFPARKARFARLRGFGNDQNQWNSILEIQVGKRSSEHESANRGARQSHTPDGRWRLEATPGGPFEAFAWTVHRDGRLDLEYRYRVDKPAVFHGLTFDLPEIEMLGFSWAGQGPERVWANRTRGTRFGSFEREFRKLRPGLDFNYPHAAGYYAGVQQAELRTKTGRIGIVSHQDDTFLRIGTNDEGKPVTAAWPDGDFSILHAIPAIGNKFQAAAVIGPQSEPHPAVGLVKGKVSFLFPAGEP